MRINFKRISNNSKNNLNRKNKSLKNHKKLLFSKLQIRVKESLPSHHSKKKIRKT